MEFQCHFSKPGSECAAADDVPVRPGHEGIAAQQRGPGIELAAQAIQRFDLSAGVFHAAQQVFGAEAGGIEPLLAMAGLIGEERGGEAARGAVERGAGVGDAVRKAPAQAFAKIVKPL